MGRDTFHRPGYSKSHPALVWSWAQGHVLLALLGGSFSPQKPLG